MLREEVLSTVKKLLETNKAVYCITPSTHYKCIQLRDVDIGEEFIYTYIGTVYYRDIVSLTVNVPMNLNAVSTSVGCDPELFFVKNGDMIPSSMVVPESGSNHVIRDGFQGELNPPASTCRQSAGSNIGYAFLEAVRLASNVGAQVSLKLGHVVSDKVWKGTPLSMRRFGCNPTENAHEKTFRRVTGLRERFRAAGGHIHIGVSDSKITSDIPKAVALMDIVVGNTCVLIDRDPDNARRRLNYGRAGEYRVKTYGIEYRVPSNFWLRSYILWSMVSQLCRNALSIQYWGKADDLISRFDMRQVRKAINENDFELAKENFNILAQFLRENAAFGYGLSSSRLDKFYTWATSKDPLEQWATIEDATESWNNKTRTGGIGFEYFIDHL